LYLAGHKAVCPSEPHVHTAAAAVFCERGQRPYEWLTNTKKKINSFTIIKEGARITRIIPVCCTQHYRCAYTRTQMPRYSLLSAVNCGATVSSAEVFEGKKKQQRVFTNRTAVAADSSVILSWSLTCVGGERVKL